MNTVDSYLMRVDCGIIDRKHKALYPIAEQRTRMADSLVRQLQALGLEKQNALPGGINVGQAVILIPENGRDPHLAVGGTTKGQHPADRSPEAESPTATTALVELPPRDDDVFSTSLRPSGDAGGPPVEEIL